MKKEKVKKFKPKESVFILVSDSILKSVSDLVRDSVRNSIDDDLQKNFKRKKK